MISSFIPNLWKMEKEGERGRKFNKKESKLYKQALFVKEKRKESKKSKV